jgi:F-type H+-transporting ATPase subunit delta
MNESDSTGVQSPNVATVTTAIPLSEDDIARLAAYLTAYFGSEVIIEKPEIDSGIIGGIIIKVEHKIIDGSIRSRLAALKRQMIKPQG